MDIMTTFLQYGWAITVVAGVLIVVLACLLIRWLWNSLVSDIFALRTVTLWEAFKILLLVSVLFNGVAFPFNFFVSETMTGDDGATKTVTYGIGSWKK